MSTAPSVSTTRVTALPQARLARRLRGSAPRARRAPAAAPPRGPRRRPRPPPHRPDPWSRKCSGGQSIAPRRLGSPGAPWPYNEAALLPGKGERARVAAVDYRLEGEIAVLTIANPPVNALSLPVREGLMQALERAGGDPAVKAIVVTGEGGTFAAGADINEVSSGLVLKSPITREAKARGQLAPFRIVDCIEAACTRPVEAAFARERESFIECRDSPQRKALVHLFFAEREARRIPGLGPEVTALPVHRAAVVGAGTMGGGIAMALANAGIPVSLLELSAQALERGLGVVGKSYDASVARGSLTRSQADAALGLIRGVSEYPALAGADIVIEAVYEDLEVKQEVFGRLDRVAGPHAILATNTSTLDIDAIAASTSRPEKVVGTHFFSPANVMRLLENVRGRHTSPEAVATVMALAKRLGQIAVLAGNCDGCIGWSTRGRASWRRALRCGRATSISCTSTATASPPGGAVRCTGPKRPASSA